MKGTRGFTLIELLVVISIIALLSAVIFAALDVARAKARDAQRKADLHDIQTAVELFKADNDGVPPGYGPGWWAYLNLPCAQPGPYTQLQPKYISVLPEDPSNPGPVTCSTNVDGYWYFYGRGRKFDGHNIVSGDSNDYVICSKLETGGISTGNVWNWSWKLNQCVGS